MRETRRGAAPMDRRAPRRHGSRKAAGNLGSADSMTPAAPARAIQLSIALRLHTAGSAEHGFEKRDSPFALTARGELRPHHPPHHRARATKSSTSARSPESCGPCRRRGLLCRGRGRKPLGNFPEGFSFYLGHRCRHCPFQPPLLPSPPPALAARRRRACRSREKVAKLSHPFCHDHPRLKSGQKRSTFRF
jgi:hypothetical protein